MDFKSSMIFFYDSICRFLQGIESLRGEKTHCLADLWTCTFPQSEGFTFDSVAGELKKRVGKS